MAFTSKKGLHGICQRKVRILKGILKYTAVLKKIWNLRFFLKRSMSIVCMF